MAAWLSTAQRVPGHHQLYCTPTPSPPLYPALALQLLRDLPEAPQLPFSYPVAMMLATVPPL